MVVDVRFLELDGHVRGGVGSVNSGGLVVGRTAQFDRLQGAISACDQVMRAVVVVEKQMLLV